MELTSCIRGLEAIHKRDIPVEVVMDSQYVISAFNEKWLEDWMKRGWQKKNNKPVINQDLWMILVALVKEFADIKFIKCLGHSGFAGNERADALANIAMKEAN